MTAVILNAMKDPVCLTPAVIPEFLKGISEIPLL
jgi:hypothetical protein